MVRGTLEFVSPASPQEVLGEGRGEISKLQGPSNQCAKGFF